MEYSERRARNHYKQLYFSEQWHRGWVYQPKLGVYKIQEEVLGSLSIQCLLIKLNLKLTLMKQRIAQFFESMCILFSFPKQSL